jgi:Rieske Fe-S protein
VTDGISAEPVSRRVLGGLTAAGLSLPVLAACGDDPTIATDNPGPSPTSSSRGGGAVASTSDIELGGGTIIADEGIVITQPTEGDFKAFDATCTHQGCQVGEVSDGTINCPCHGSQFSIEDGAPERGPATAPLKEVAITVKGDQIQLA